jgi:hemerythrin
MATGNPLVDGEHQRLLRRLDEILHLAAARAGSKILLERLVRFVQEIGSHLQREHQLLRDAGFAELERHEQEDGLFLQLCQDVLGTLDHDLDIELSAEAVLFLRQQVIQHIYHTDAPLREHFQGRARREPLLAWSPLFSVGELSLDQEHQGLIDHVNQLYQLLDQPEERGPILMELHDFLEHARDHFEHEARLMTGLAQAERSAHIEEHDRMLDQAAAWVGRIERGEEQPSREQLLGFIRDWVVRHILFVDMRVKSHFSAERS